MRGGNNSDTTWRLLKYAYGVLPILTGIDKFTNVLVTWEGYISPKVLTYLPIDVTLLFQIVGFGEIILGLIILSRWTRIGALIETVWLMSIAAVVTIGGFYDIALRDIILALGAYVLSQVTHKRAYSSMNKNI